MTLYKDGGSRVVECESCPEVEILGDADAPFDTAVALMKELGWLIVNPRGAWEHYCPGCREEMDV